MQLNIVTDEKDQDALSAFCLATGWNVVLGQSKEDWLYDRVNEYISTHISSGFTVQATMPAREAYAAAVEAVAADVAAEMAQVEIVKGGGGIVVDPIKEP